MTMDSISRVTKFEKKLESLLGEVRELKNYIHSLEKQNETLRKKLYHNESSTKEGWANLKKLYQDGFHVCPVHFGRTRENDSDCLFCISFINSSCSEEEL